LSINPKESHPHQKAEDRVQKLALNIVHAVEFSRNGRTRISALRPASRATYLLYHFSRELGAPGAFSTAALQPGNHSANAGSSEEVEFILGLKSPSRNATSRLFG
jgi:hypothetical protein